MNGDRQKFWLGVFALATLGMLAILITFFGGFLDLFVSQYHYTVKFPQAPGVEPGTLIRKSGVRIGEVQAITLNPDNGEVLVEFTVSRKHQLRLGDQALLGRGLLIGDTVINFVPEGTDRELAPEGHMFQGKVSQDLSQVLGKTGELVPLTKETLEEFRVAIKSINQFMPELKRTNAEAEVALHNFGKASETIDNVLRGNQDRILKAIDQFVETAHQLTLLLNDENQRQINATIKNIRQAAENLAGFMTEDNRRNVNDLLKNAKNASDELAKILTDDNEKNLNALLKNLKTSSDSLDQTMKKADQLMTEARANLRTISDRADSVGKTVEEMAKDGRGAVKQLNETLANADHMVADIRQATKPIAERAPRILKNVEESSAQLNLILLQAGDTLRFFQEADGTLHRLVADPALYNSINEAAAAISKSAGRLDRIIQDFGIFADKVARHPELLGVSGAVQPSTGLKR